MRLLNEQRLNIIHTMLFYHIYFRLQLEDIKEKKKKASRKSEHTTDRTRWPQCDADCMLLIL